jgi:acyl-CoA thioester hydrolase
VSAFWEKEVEIRWRDLDASRHVNNAVYLTYLEEVRTEWLGRVLGNPEAVWGFVLARVAIDYRRELRLEDRAAVAGCRLQGIGTSSITSTERIRTLDGELAAEAEAVTVAWNQAAGESRPLTGAERTALQRAQSE